jgi:hypothetical protein
MHERDSMPTYGCVPIKDGDMGKRRFFDRSSGLTVADIISLTGAECSDEQRLSHLITDI